MNYDKLKNELHYGEIKNLYLLYGNEDYLKKAVADRLYSIADSDAESSLEKIRFEKGMTAGDLAQAINTLSFFGNGKFILCMNTEIFKGTGGNADFEAILGDIPPGIYVVFSETSVDKKNILFTEMNKAGFAYSIDMRKRKDLSKYISNKFKRLKKRISYDNINLFIEYSGNSLTDIESDIEKITLFMGSKADVKKEYIINLCSGTRQYRIYEMLDGIFNRNAEIGLKIMRELLDDKIPVQMLLASIHSRLRELADIREALDKGRDPVIYRKGRPIADFIIKRLRTQAAKYTLGRLRNSIILAADTDIGIKSGKIGDVSGLEILVNTLTAV